MSMVDKQERDQRRRAQREGVKALEAPGALDSIYALIDAGQLKLDGDDGFIQQLIKAGLERGSQAELTGHVGYEKGDSEVGVLSQLAQRVLPENGRHQRRRCRAFDPQGP